MESPGEHLKREREHRGVTLQMIFESTRVPMKYLEAIEADSVEGLPHPAFVKGFIRNYCKVLGIDDNDAVLRYEVWLADMNAEANAAGKASRAEEARQQKVPAVPFPSEKLRPYLGKIAVVVAGVVIVVLAYSLTRRDISTPGPQALSPASEPLSMAPAEPTTAASAGQASEAGKQLAPQAAPPAVTPAPGVPMRLPAPAPKEPDVPLSTVFQGSASKAVEPVQPTAPAVPSMTLPAHKSVPEPVSEAEPVKKPVEAAPVAQVVKKDAPVQQAKPAVSVEQPRAAHTLVVSARETVWLKVEVDKQSPVEVLLKKGERFTWRASEKIAVVIGNAGGVTVNYNGKDLTGLGASGEVVGLNLPGGSSYKIKPQAPSEAPQPPAINMPEIPQPVKTSPAE